jgi:hypothetical protein
MPSCDIEGENTVHSCIDMRRIKRERARFDMRTKRGI